MSMASMAQLELRAEREGDVVRLRSPGVGSFTCAASPGRVLVGGEVAGVLVTLGHAFELVVPEGVAGVVRNAAPEPVHAPVGYGAVLYELDVEARAAVPSAASVATSPESTARGVLAFRSPSAGRFWHRTAPGEPPLASAGDVLEPGRAIGVIEVMKTFTLVQYAATGSLPARAKVVRVLAADGSEVADKAPLLEIEPA
jgi:biotin carboxyl carrier protein